MRAEHAVQSFLQHGPAMGLQKSAQAARCSLESRAFGPRSPSGSDEPRLAKVLAAEKRGQFSI